MKIKNIAIYALLTGGLGLSVMTSGIALSQAAEGTVKGAQLITFNPESPADAWKATQVSAEKSKHPYCSVEAKFAHSGATMVLARNKKGLNSLAMDFGRDLFEKGQTYQLAIGTDIGLERRYEARALTPSLLMAQVGLDKPFMRAIGYNGDFTFFVPQTVRAKFTLAGADDAMERLERCLSTLEDFIPPLADETYLREARATVVKKRPSAGNTLVDERAPSQTVRAKIAQREEPVPLPPRKADNMHIKVTKVEPPVVYEPPASISEDDSIAQPDKVEIASKELSAEIDKMAAENNHGAGTAEEHLTVKNSTFTPERTDKKTKPDTAPETTVAAAEPEADTETVEAVAVMKAGDDGATVVADVSDPVDTAVPQQVAEATPPSQDELMSPMPGEIPVHVETAPVKIEVAADGSRRKVVAEADTKPIIWHEERMTVNDPAAKNIMALEKRGKSQETHQAVQKNAAAAAPATDDVRTASAASLLPTPDISIDLPAEGAYFPEQTQQLSPEEIEKAIVVKVEKPDVQPASDVATGVEKGIESGTQMASLQAVNGPFDAAEYQRLKTLSQKKHNDAQKVDEPVSTAEPISLTGAMDEDIASIATAAGEDLETAAMMPDPLSKVTGERAAVSFSTTGTLSREDYLALKKHAPDTQKKNALLRQSSLSDAVAQLVPMEYQITVGNGVDMNQTVSWREGENWQDVIAATLGPIGIEAEVHGSVVMLMTMAR